MLQRALTVSGGGGGTPEITFTLEADRINGNGQSFFAIETALISHFKSVYNESVSPYADYNSYIVGYTNSIPKTADRFSSLTNSVALGNADFDVDKTYAYLVVTCTGNTYGRAYDITLTF